ncbi:Pre-mRNA 3'-end-processing factor FIP1 [Trichinella papuae]|uniref:Pre-mRNA 3'-end-processing factor FIP1 n=1 Tax=Trichinella papuae TaxID=268474 RepID=A0A0V1N4D7_9BILA|nr:Pre-mRNA 3'-end-processing factor FIP1 [Trichinella papuae]
MESEAADTEVEQVQTSEEIDVSTSSPPKNAGAYPRIVVTIEEEDQDNNELNESSASKDSPKENHAMPENAEDVSSKTETANEQTKEINAFEELSSDDEDNICITIGDVKPTLPTANFRQMGQKSGNMRYSNKLDIDSTGTYNGTPIFDVDIATIEAKPWREPGADVTDYFNYGFTEETWQTYCERQKRLRTEFGPANANKAYFNSIPSLNAPARVGGPIPTITSLPPPAVAFSAFLPSESDRQSTEKSSSTFNKIKMTDKNNRFACDDAEKEPSPGSCKGNGDSKTKEPLPSSTILAAPPCVPPHGLGIPPGFPPTVVPPVPGLGVPPGVPPPNLAGPPPHFGAPPPPGIGFAGFPFPPPCRPPFPPRNGDDEPLRYGYNKRSDLDPSRHGGVYHSSQGGGTRRSRSPPGLSHIYSRYRSRRRSRSLSRLSPEMYCLDEVAPDVDSLSSNTYARESRGSYYRRRSSGGPDDSSMYPGSGSIYGNSNSTNAAGGSEHRRRSRDRARSSRDHSSSRRRRDDESSSKRKKRHSSRSRRERSHDSARRSGSYHKSKKSKDAHRSRSRDRDSSSKRRKKSKASSSRRGGGGGAENEPVSASSDRH